MREYPEHTIGSADPGERTKDTRHPSYGCILPLRQGPDWRGRFRHGNGPSPAPARGQRRLWEIHKRIANSRSDRSARKCRSEEHTSELQSLMRISYAVFCLKKKK